LKANNKGDCCFVRREGNKEMKERKRNGREMKENVKMGDFLGVACSLFLSLARLDNNNRKNAWQKQVWLVCMCVGVMDT